MRTALNRSFNADALEDEKPSRRLVRGNSMDEPAMSASTDMLNGHHDKASTLE